MPVNAGSRMRTGAPFENARITPATPTPAPRSADPDTTAWIVSPAPWVPNASIDGVRLNGTAYESMGRKDAKFAREDRALRVEMTADAARD